MWRPPASRSAFTRQEVAKRAAPGALGGTRGTVLVANRDGRRISANSSQGRAAQPEVLAIGPRGERAQWRWRSAGGSLLPLAGKNLARHPLRFIIFYDNIEASLRKTRPSGWWSSDRFPRRWATTAGSKKVPSRSGPRGWCTGRWGSLQFVSARRTPAKRADFTHQGRTRAAANGKMFAGHPQHGGVRLGPGVNGVCELWFNDTGADPDGDGTMVHTNRVEPPCAPGGPAFHFWLPVLAPGRHLRIPSRSKPKANRRLTPPGVKAWAGHVSPANGLKVYTGKDVAPQ